MNLQDLINQNNKIRPPRILVYSVPGWGKSSLAASMPSPIFLDIEDGLTGINAPALPVPKNYDEFESHLGMLINDDHDYKTVIIDTLSSLELLVNAKTCMQHGKNSLEDFGYGKGYQFAMTYWEKIMRGMDKLREKGIAPVLLAHSEIKTINDPILDPYDKYVIKLHKHAQGMFMQWSDNVFFGTHKTIVSTNGEGFKKQSKGIGQGERVLFTEQRPAFAAKSRLGLPFEIDIPKINGWDAISQFINNDNTINE